MGVADMAYDDDDDLDQDERWDGNVRNLPAGLRQHIRKLEKQSKEQGAELENLRRDARTRTIQNVLTAKGVNPKLAAFIQPDVEASEEALGRWIDDYADVFNVKPSTQDQAAAAPQSAPVDPRTGQASALPNPFVAESYVDAANTQALMNAAGQEGSPVEVAGDLLAKIQAATSVEDLDLLRTGTTARARFG